MTATGTGTLREIVAKACAKGRRTWTGDDRALIDADWMCAGFVLAAIAEAGLGLAPAGGTLTAAELEAIKTAVEFAEWMAEEDPWLEDFKVSSVPGGRRLRELVEVEGFDFPSAEDIATLKAIVERGVAND